MCHIVTCRVGNTCEKLKETVSDDEPFGLERHGREEQEDGGIGEHHAECKKDAKDGTRCTHGDIVVDVSFTIVEQFGVGHRADLVAGNTRISHHQSLCHRIVHAPTPSELLDKGSTHAADQIIDEETLRAPDHLEQSSEHIEREHVAEEVGEVGVHEHVGERLPYVIIRGIVIMQTQELGEVDSLGAKHIVGNEHHHVDDDEIECHRSCR